MTPHELGQIVIWTAGVVTALGVLTRTRPARWLGRTLVRDPIIGAFRREVVDVVRAEVPGIVDERLAARPLTNGWGTDAVAAIAEATGADVRPPPPPAVTAETDRDPPPPPGGP